MKKIIVCSLVGAVVAQIWGMASWMVLPWHNWDFREFKNESRVAEVIRSETQGSGLYTLPNMDMEAHKDEKAMAEWNAKARRGPFAFISVKADGIEPGMGVPMAVGFLLNILIAGILFWTLGQTKLKKTFDRVLFLGVVGSVGSIYPHLSNLNWWHFPASYCLVGVIDLFVTWSLAGFAMTKVMAKVK